MARARVIQSFIICLGPIFVMSWKKWCCHFSTIFFFLCVCNAISLDEVAWWKIHHYNYLQSYFSKKYESPIFVLCQLALPETYEQCASNKVFPVSIMFMFGRLCIYYYRTFLFFLTLKAPISYNFYIQSCKIMFFMQ